MCVCWPVILLLGSLASSSVARLVFVGRDGPGPGLAWLIVVATDKRCRLLLLVGEGEGGEGRAL